MSWWLDVADLDEDQKDVIDLPANGNHLILGPPGSGKTNLLLLRAGYLIRDGHPNIYVLMFNAPLHDFVTRGSVNYDVPNGKIRKIMSWELVLLRENGIVIDDSEGDDDLEARRKAIAQRVLALFEANPKLERHLECLLVDEVQDCLPDEIEVFLRAAKHVTFAGDSKQRIFGSADVLQSLEKKMNVVTLKTHYRIGHQICRAADVVAKAAGMEQIEANCNYKDAEAKVNFILCADEAEQIKKLIEALKIQLTAYPGELLGVSVPRIADREKIRSALEASELSAFLLPHRESGSDNTKQQIYVAHMREIKGLEFRTVHLVFMEHLSKLGENQKRIAYTAMTRGKTTLSVYYAGRIPGYLEQAKVAVEPPKPKPQIKDLFTKKSKATP